MKTRVVLFTIFVLLVVSLGNLSIAQETENPYVALGKFYAEQANMSSVPNAPGTVLRAFKGMFHIQKETALNSSNTYDPWTVLRIVAAIRDYSDWEFDGQTPAQDPGGLLWEAYRQNYQPVYPDWSMSVVGADLPSRLTETSLQQVSINGSALDIADNLENADLRGLVFYSTNFYHLNAVQAQFDQCLFSGKFYSCKLNGTGWKNAYMESMHFEHCTLTGSSLNWNAYRTSVTMSQTVLHNANTSDMALGQEWDGNATLDNGGLVLRFCNLQSIVMPPEIRKRTSILHCQNVPADLAVVTIFSTMLDSITAQADEDNVELARYNIRVKNEPILPAAIGFAIDSDRILNLRVTVNGEQWGAISDPSGHSVIYFNGRSIPENEWTLVQVWADIRPYAPTGTMIATELTAFTYRGGKTGGYKFAPVGAITSHKILIKNDEDDVGAPAVTNPGTGLMPGTGSGFTGRK